MLMCSVGTYLFLRVLIHSHSRHSYSRTLLQSAYRSQFCDNSRRDEKQDDPVHLWYGRIWNGHRKAGGEGKKKRRGTMQRVSWSTQSNIWLVWHRVYLYRLTPSKATEHPDKDLITSVVPPRPCTQSNSTSDYSVSQLITPLEYAKKYTWT